MFEPSTAQPPGITIINHSAERSSFANIALRPPPRPSGHFFNWFQAYLTGIVPHLHPAIQENRFRQKPDTGYTAALCGKMPTHCAVSALGPAPNSFARYGLRQNIKSDLPAESLAPPPANVFEEVQLAVALPGTYLVLAEFFLRTTSGDLEKCGPPFNPKHPLTLWLPAVRVPKILETRLVKCILAIMEEIGLN